MAGKINEYGGDYGYIWWEGDGDWVEVKNTGTRSMIDQIANQMSSATGMFGPVDENENENENKNEEMVENYKTKWNQFITESSAIDDQWTLYVKSLVNAIRLNGVDDYIDFTEDDFKEDFDNYIADKMDL